MREQRVALKHGIDMPVFSGDIGDVMVFKMDPASVDVFQSGNQAKNGGFTAARRAKQGEELTIFDGQIEIGDDRFTIKAFAYPRQLHQR
ncbi:hypothetical protein HMPREF0880_03061 [Yokenella regensburgei ATCC 43003]|nr:hypothetical protein HMPREF0880_03061 [Yokenella regensburgei ATCC 43003]